jgi:16S rRNA C1402 N4-methylase RsmH
VLESQRITKGIKMSILEFYAIVTMNRSRDILRKLILQLKNQISSMSKILILCFHEKHARMARKVIKNHENIKLCPKRAILRRTNNVHVKQLARLVGHHLEHERLGSKNHFTMMTRVADKLFLIL